MCLLFQSCVLSSASFCPHSLLLRRLGGDGGAHMKKVGAMELAKQSVLCKVPNGNLAHFFKDTEFYVGEWQHPDDDYLQESHESKAGNTATVAAFNSKDMEGLSVSVLNGEFCGLATQCSMEYVDMIAIRRAEVVEVEDGELEGQKKELSNHDTREVKFQTDSINVTMVDGLKDRDFTESFILEDSSTLANDAAFAQGDSRDVSRKTNGLLITNHELPLMEAQSNEREGQVRLLGASSASFEGVEGTHLEEKDGRPLDNSIIREHEDKCLQNVEERDAGNVKDVPLKDDEIGPLQHAKATSDAPRKAGFEENCGNMDQAGYKGSTNILIVEMVGDTAHSRDAGGFIGTGSVDPADNSKADDGDDTLQSDKDLEHLEDGEHMPSAFSGPIAFSGLLSYSGMISQIPYSGNLSLHSDSSTSTRSFAFPILPSDWNSSPAKIGPPDSKYFRRRRRWRPCFCCKSPTTLYD